MKDFSFKHVKGDRMEEDLLAVSSGSEFCLKWEPKKRKAELQPLPRNREENLTSVTGQEATESQRSRF